MYLFLKTKIQDETCEKRTLATIATHDITKLKGDCLHYEAKNPNQISVSNHRLSALEKNLRIGDNTFLFNQVKELLVS